MYIENERWEKLLKNFKKLYSNYDYFSDDIRDLLDNVDISIDNIDQNKSNKLYVVTNNAIVDDEISYDIKGIAFTRKEAKKLYEEAITEAKIDCNYANLGVDDSISLDEPDENWNCIKTDDSFELYLEGEYNSNNFEISILEYDIDKNSELPKISECSNLLQQVYDCVCESDASMCHVDEDDWIDWKEDYNFTDDDIEILKKEIQKYGLAEVVVIDEDEYKIVGYSNLQFMFNDDRNIEKKGGKNNDHGL